MIDRIKQLLDWQQLSPTQFADRIGVGRPVVSHILSERNKPSLEVARSIKAAFPELSLDWLVNGSGEMLATAPPAAVAPASSSASVSATAPPVPTSAPTSSLAAAMPIAPARPAEATTDSQPASYQRATLGMAGPARFRASGAPPIAAFELGAARFVAGPAKPQPTGPVTAQPAASFNPASPPPSAGMPAPVPTAMDEASVATVAPPASTPLAPAMPEAAGLAQVMSESLGDPGKTIRRIVLFYTDGSFADFKPE
ncbi:MAG: helix-turn-helix domain-containing protein [Hymenobacter sp.]|nr:MAG: helix-turn-helix domain-containing protein [Hymenobacter sp.]